MNANSQNELSHMFRGLLEAVWQHVPVGADWLPAVWITGLGLAGVILLLRGARLAPAVAGLGFAALGMASGVYLSKAIAVPLWPSVVCLGLVGGLLGVLLFRLWLALFLTVVLTFAGGSVYYVRVLTPYVAGYTSKGWNPQTNLNSLNPASDEPRQAPVSTAEEFKQFHRYLSESVPGFNSTSLKIVGVSGGLSLLLALLLPWTARSLWAALVGTGLLAVFVLQSLVHFWPEGLTMLMRIGPWSWAMLVALALGSFAYNLRSGFAPRAGPPAAAPAGARAR